ncbi:unnamed protein product, partial [Ectocarpus fasciculatus]
MTTADRADKACLSPLPFPSFLLSLRPFPPLCASVHRLLKLGGIIPRLCGGSRANPHPLTCFPVCLKPCTTTCLSLNRITEDLLEQSSVKEVVLTHYVTLVEVFKHYASIGSALATGEIDIMEASG